MKVVQNNRALTLIELLVTIAIVSVLAVLLVTGAKRFQGYARSVQCISNLKSMHVGIASYGQDNQMEVPVDRANNATGMSWYMAIMPYMPNSEKVSSNPYLCPDNPNTKSDRVGWTNYAINSNLYDGGTNLNDPPSDADPQQYMNARSARRLGSVSGQKVLLIDSFNGKDGTWYGNDGARWGKDWPDCYAVHNDKVNVLFVDGHIEGVKVFPRDVNSLSDLNQLKAEWFWPLN